MQYVHFDFSTYQGHLYVDACPYVERLEELKPLLPPGALRFVSEPGHYEFGGRCMHDLEIEELRITEPGRQRLSLELRFRRNQFKHDADLTLSYVDIASLDVRCADEFPAPHEASRLGDVIIDELLPHAAGIVHEIAFHYGSIKVTSADVTATWEP